MGNNLPAKAKKSGRNPDFGPLRMGGEMASDTQSDMTGGIFAWSFRVAVASGLRWDDVLNSAPNTLVLTIGGLTGFAAKTKTRGVSEGRPWGKSDFAFLMKNGCQAVTTSLCHILET